MRKYTRFRRAVAIVCSTLIWAAFTAAAGPVLNYQGRITSQDTGFSGTGQFKFVLINQSAEAVWSNDGSPGTGEPASSVAVNVDNGLFHVNLGDGSMNPIAGIALHAQELHLRVWFSDGESGFEQLAPDTQIRALNFSQINTGNLLIVDKEGLGDFASIQDAVNHAATLWDVAIVIMPGRYTETIVFPAHSFLTLRGAAAGGAVQIDSAATTLAFGDGAQVRIENLSVSGSPALSDAALPPESWSEMTLRNCELSNSSHLSTDPTVSLTQSGTLTLIDSQVNNHAQGSSVMVSGSSRLEANRSRFEASDAPAALIQQGNHNIYMESCTLRSNQSVSLRADQNGGWSTFDQCRFESGIDLTDAAGALFFYGCRFNAQGQNPAVRIVGGHPNTSFDNCRFHSLGATAIYVEDAPGWLDLHSCRINAQNAVAIEMIATAEIDLGEDADDWWIALRSCVVSTHGDGDAPAVRLSNAYGDDLEMEIEFLWSDVMGNNRDAVEIGEGCMLYAEYTLFEGARHGIYAPDGAEVELIKCNVWGAEDEAGAGIQMRGAGFVFVQGCEIIGEEGGAGLALDFTEGGKAIIAQSLISGFGDSALVVTGGTVHANQSTFFTHTSPVATLAGTNANHRFNHCTFKSVEDFIDDEESEPAESPAVLLAGAQGRTPVPRFFACSFEPAAEADYSIALAEAASGNIVLINSQLLKPVESGIANNGADAYDAWGNAFFNLPE